ncbi:unnamed protein product [Amaranthus hypochondriacus]
MGREMLGVMMIMGVLLAMVPNTMQQIQPIKTHVGLILSTASDEALLLDSGYYVHEYTVKKAGRTFKVGKFNDLNVVYVIALAPLSHVSATVQILVESFAIRGIIDYGNAGAVNPSLGFGDVAVLSKTAFASAWTWEEYESNSNSLEALASLKIGKYNVPEAGDNELGSLKFNKIPKYTPYSANKETFWYYIDPDWYKIALKLKDEVTLENCVNDVCNIVVPSVAYGAKGASSDIYVSNVAYAEFLHNKFGFSTVDRKAAATVSTAVANGVNHVVFRGASNKPGVAGSPINGALASKNTLKMVAAFIDQLPKIVPV